MKILHIVPYYKPAYIYGGPIASVSKLCESQHEVGAQVLVVTTNANGKRDKLPVISKDVISVSGVDVLYFDSFTNDNTFISFSLWKYLFRNVKQYDIVHIHTWWNFLVLVATFICKLKKVKVVLSPRGMLSNYIFNSTNSKVKRMLHNIFGKKLLTDTLFNATSEQEYRECKLLIPEWKGFILPNILDLPEIEVVRSFNNIFTLSFLSRIDPKKGLEFVFKAISQIDFKVIFRIAGKGDETYIRELKILANDLGIESSIQWVGWMGQEDKYTELMNADLFVLASHNENFANVVIESLYVGTPVLISNNVGLADYVVENDLGWVTNLDVQQIADTLNEIMHSKEKLHAINQKANRLIKDDFSPTTLANRYISEYNKFLYAGK